MTMAYLVTLVLALVVGPAAPVIADLCPTEDSAACVWVGPAQGNERGKVAFTWS